MNNSNNAPGDDLDEQFSPFERMLRDHSLAAGPQKRGELFYECGYAAGVAEAKKRLERATRRWRVVGVAASVLACASFVIQLRSFESNNSNQVVVERPVNADQAEAVTTNHKAAADDWLTLLTMERRTVGDDRDVLRASSSMQIFSEQNDPAGELTPIGPSDQESILQPGDFQQFL
jgi:hypothetical protein